MSGDVYPTCERQIVVSNKGDNQINCVLCEKNFHNHCVNLTTTLCKVIASSACLWLCPSCRKSGDILRQVVREFSGMKIRLTECEERMKVLETKKSFLPNINSPAQNKRSYASLLTNTSAPI